MSTDLQLAMQLLQSGRAEEAEARLDAVIAARNSFMHPKPDGLALEMAGLPEGLLVTCHLTRHLILTQPARPSMVSEERAASIRESLRLAESSVDFWRTVIAPA